MNATRPVGAPATSTSARPLAIAIIGSGFAGQCMAIKLKQAGQNDFVILERGESVGGTWRDNAYPGAACDVPSHLYSFSFEQNPDWSHKYPRQPELYAYLQRTAEKYGLLPHLRFNHNVTGAEYDEARQLWTIHTSQGDITARVVVSGSGGLSEPSLPDIRGIETFAGKTFHSARWDHGYDLAGKRVAVIGTGASAIQFVPQIAPKVARLDVYQRTPPWIIPRPDRAITAVEKFLLRHVKPLQWLYRWAIYWGHEFRVLGIVVHPALMKAFQKIGERHIHRQVKNPLLRKLVTPNYLIGCKRILVSNDWYPALERANVSLITNGIREIRAHSIVSADGNERPIDAIIFGTGFYATDNPMSKVIRGRGGVSLSENWKNGEEAYLGTLVAGYPNWFQLVGPNTGVGHTSMVFIIETQVRYVMKCLAEIRDKNLRTLEVRDAVQAAYNLELQQRLGGSVWSTGCQSWYKNKNGKITVLWPGFTFDFWWRLRKFRAGDFTATRAGA